MLQRNYPLLDVGPIGEFNHWDRRECLAMRRSWYSDFMRNACMNFGTRHPMTHAPYCTFSSGWAEAEVRGTEQGCLEGCDWEIPKGCPACRTSSRIFNCFISSTVWTCWNMTYRNCSLPPCWGCTEGQGPDSQGDPPNLDWSQGDLVVGWPDFCDSHEALRVT